MTVFEMVKADVDIVEAAQRYGIKINRSKKALCPFHDDAVPSLSFKGEIFTCFGCGAHGDVIDLVGRLNNTLPIETVRELNHTFNLNIDVDKPIDNEQRRLREQRLNEERAYQSWLIDAADTYSVYFRLLSQWRQERAPTAYCETLDPRFVESLTKMDYVEYLIDSVFISGGKDTKRQFYLSHTKQVKDLKERLAKEYRNNAGRTATDDPQIGGFIPALISTYIKTDTAA